MQPYFALTAIGTYSDTAVQAAQPSNPVTSIRHNHTNKPTPMGWSQYRTSLHLFAGSALLGGLKQGTLNKRAKGVCERPHLPRPWLGAMMRNRKDLSRRRKQSPVRVSDTICTAMLTNKTSSYGKTSAKQTPHKKYDSKALKEITPLEEEPLKHDMTQSQRHAAQGRATRW